MSGKNQSNVIIVTCPGGSNVSLLAYNAASTLEKQGYCKSIRLSGDRFPEKDRQKLSEAQNNTSKWVLVEGCSKGCAKKVLDSAGVKPDEHFLVTSIGIERENKFDYTTEEFDKVLLAVKKILEKYF